MKSLLVLEEDLEGRKILSKMLHRRGFNVMSAANEAAALAVLDEDSQIDLVLAGAAYRDRLAFLAALRRRWPSLPVVFLADCPDDEVRQQDILGGFSVSRKHNVFVNTRPIQFRELDRLIRIVPRPTKKHLRAGVVHSEVA